MQKDMLKYNSLYNTYNNYFKAVIHSKGKMFSNNEKNVHSIPELLFLVDENSFPSFKQHGKKSSAYLIF